MCLFAVFTVHVGQCVVVSVILVSPIINDLLFACSQHEQRTSYSVQVLWDHDSFNSFRCELENCKLITPFGLGDEQLVLLNCCLLCPRFKLKFIGP
jgi:hypothetical protein